MSSPDRPTKSEKLTVGHATKGGTVGNKIAAARFPPHFHHEWYAHYGTTNTWRKVTRGEAKEWARLGGRTAYRYVSALIEGPPR